MSWDAAAAVLVCVSCCVVVVFVVIAAAEAHSHEPPDREVSDRKRITSLICVVCVTGGRHGVGLRCGVLVGGEGRDGSDKAVAQPHIGSCVCV